MGYIYPSIETRILDNVEIQLGPVMTGCWEWQLSLDRQGYARTKFEGEQKLVHRVSYEHFIAPIPVGFQIDHLCANKACVNPTHLEPVTPAVSAIRGPSSGAVNKAKQYCARKGHSLSGTNLIVNPTTGNRACYACKLETTRNWKRRNRRRN